MSQGSFQSTQPILTPKQGCWFPGADLVTSAALCEFTPGIYVEEFNLAATPEIARKHSKTCALEPDTKGPQEKRKAFLFIIPALIESEVDVYTSQGGCFER